MRAGLMVAVPVAQVVAWRVVARGRLSVWTTVAPLFGVAGVLSVVANGVDWSPRVSAAVASGAGLGAGLALYAGTRIFVALVAGWPAFARHTADLYDQRAGLSLGAALAIVALVVAPGEELFWRGLFQSQAVEATSRLGGALLAWAAYVVANAASGRLPIIAGAVVGGAAWGALAWWTGGVLAPIACHAVWTGLMVALPPRAAEAA
jgi:membrane protease YdiL (CAAX protease family)